MTLAYDFQVVSERVRFLTNSVVKELQARASEGIERVGVSILGNIQEAYDAKARHGTGSDGVKWDELQRATLEARVRRRKAARDIVAKRRALAEQAKQYRAGGGKGFTRKGVKFNGDAAVKQLELERKTLSAKLQGLVDAEVANHEIGVDTGLQINSASPGLPSDPVWFRKPTDSLGANIFRIEVGSVTIGYDRVYSAAFDKRRSLIPTSLPDPWRTEAEGVLMTWGDLVVNESLN